MIEFDSRIEIMKSQGFNVEQLPELKKFIQLIWKRNLDLNLFSRQMSPDDLVNNHLIDCLMALPYFAAASFQCVADLGSGGGFPGVVLALQFPKIKFLLFEKSPKKQKFLTECKKLAPNLEVVGEISKLPMTVDLITARAFKPLDVIIDMTSSYYSRRGKYILFKARMSTIDEEIKLTQSMLTKKKLNPLQRDQGLLIVPLKSPVLEVERHLVLIN